MAKIRMPPKANAVRVRCKDSELPGRLKVLGVGGRVIADIIVASREPIELPNDAMSVETSLAVEFLPLGAR